MVHMKGTGIDAIDKKITFAWNHTDFEFSYENVQVTFLSIKLFEIFPVIKHKQLGICTVPQSIFISPN